MNRIFWNESPALRIALFFISGIVVGYYSGLNLSDSILYSILASILIVWLFSFFIKSDWKRIKLQSQWSFISVFILGFLLLNLKINNQNQMIQTFSTHENYHVLALIESLPDEKEKTYKVDLKIISLKTADTTLYLPHKSIAYFAKDSLSSNLKPGQHVLLNSPLNEFKKPVNPGNTDFSKIYRNKNILSTVYLPKNNWKLTDIQIKNFNSLLYQWRLKIKNILNENLTNSNSNALISALLLGQQSSIDKETKAILVDAGIIHILAVSGLHVGIIYLLFNYLTFFIQNNKYRFIKLSIVLLGIWLFVFITGVPPSAFRAAVMFSFFAFGKNLNLQSNSFNIIAASAIFMLLTNPLLIFDVGFQLSYSAVLGIITFQRPIYSSLYTGKNKIINYGWSLTSVSIAATLGTLIFTLYNFNRFPTYFIFTNLLAIPTAFVLLLSGIALIVLHPIPMLAQWISQWIDFWVQALISITSHVQYLPLHVVKNIYPNIIQSLFLAIILLLIGIMAKSRKTTFQLTITLLVVICLYTTHTLVSKYKHIHQKEIIVLQVSKSRVLALNNGLKTTFLYRVGKQKQLILSFREY
jgi:competence protein ComEC